jgi:hypothetical protein
MSGFLNGRFAQLAERNFPLIPDTIASLRNSPGHFILESDDLCKNANSWRNGPGALSLDLHIFSSGKGRPPQLFNGLSHLWHLGVDPLSLERGYSQGTLSESCGADPAAIGKRNFL